MAGRRNGLTLKRALRSAVGFPSMLPFAFHISLAFRPTRPACTYRVACISAALLVGSWRATPAARTFTDYVRAKAPNGQTARIPLKMNKIFGAATSRGQRAYQEDFFSAHSIHIDPAELKSSLFRAGTTGTDAANAAAGWTVRDAGGDEMAGQVVWFGIFDGHGSAEVSAFLRDELHACFENATIDEIVPVVDYTRSLGGYFRRFRGGLLSAWYHQLRTDASRHSSSSGSSSPVHLLEGSESGKRHDSAVVDSIASASSMRDADRRLAEALEAKEKALAEEAASPSNADGAGSSGEQSREERRRLARSLRDLQHEAPAPGQGPGDTTLESLSIAERATLAFLKADRKVMTTPSLNKGGSTASVMLLHSLDTPTAPYFSSEKLSVNIAHCGDTRVLLSTLPNGLAEPLTNYHHPDEPSEAQRLRRLGAGMVTDSFGEARWMGAVANTRGFGDSQYKRMGVTAEPAVISRILKGDEHAFLIAFSDGIGSVMSDQEIVDLCRECSTPAEAAKSVLTFAEELGADDNCTVLVIPLRGWGKMGGEDTTKERREFRRSKIDLYRDSRQ